MTSEIDKLKHFHAENYSEPLYLKIVDLLVILV